MHSSINVHGRLLSLNEPIVMGILNLTPDSFFDGGKFDTTSEALFKAEKMIAEGATIIDIGAQSTRPGAERISAEDELSRLIEPLKAIAKEFPQAIISVDTFYAQVAISAVDHGAAIINDVSAGSIDPTMFVSAAKLNVPYILMHMQGEPQTMQKKPQYNNIISDLVFFFSQKINELRTLGLNDIIIDPGFGFGKSIEHNFTILKNLDQLSMFDLPILVGMSRKKMIQRIIERDADESLNGTTAANMLALMNGAKILRVHDVREAIEACKLFNAYAHQF